MYDKYSTKGSITVFLSMTLLIIISLIMTTTEALRVYSMSVYSQRALYTALDSVLAEYYYPLFDHYHVFGLDGTYSSNQIQDKKIEDKITEYLDYTLKPSLNAAFGGFNIPIKTFNIIDIDADNVKIEDIKTLMDYEGELFRSQAIDYTKFSLAGDGVTKLLDEIGIIKDLAIEDLGSNQTVIKKKIDTEESVSKFTEDVIKLASLLDGIVITNRGPMTLNNGNLSINNSFVKKICTSTATISNPYPANSWVSASLKGKYVSPNSIVNESISYLDQLVENDNIREKAEATLKEKSKINRNEIEEEGELNKLIKEINDLKEIIKDCDKEERLLLNQFKNKLSYINNLVINTSSSIQKAISLTNGLNSKQDSLTDKINNYGFILLESKDDLSTELYSSFTKDYTELEKYKTDSNQSDSYDFTSMRITLVNNKDILDEAKGNLNIGLSSNKDTWVKAKEQLNKVKTSFSKYSHKNLQLDYSSLTKKQEGPDIFSGINDLINDGLLFLILPDGDELSDKTLKGKEKQDLPSNIYKNMDSTTSFLSSNIQDFDLNNSFGFFSNMIEGFSKSFSETNLLASSADWLGGVALYQKYLLDHFAAYGSNTKVEMPTSLEYEVEYILNGKGSDKENITSLVFNLIILRTISNSISLFSNPKSNTEATKLATTLVGYLGIPVLISITKTIIMLIWAFAESLIETSALLRGKSIAIYKQLKDFNLQLSELPFISKTYISQKVNKMVDKDSLRCLDYNDHLNILLLIKKRELKTFRALDLIQINLQNNYEDTFLISNCIYGIQVSSNFSMEEKFVTLPFINKTTGSSNQKYLHNTEIEYSY